MINIEMKAVVNKKFKTNVGNDEWTAIGVASHPEQSSFYVVGMVWDQASNRTRIKTFKFDEVNFVGDATAGI